MRLDAENRAESNGTCSPPAAHSHSHTSYNPSKFSTRGNDIHRDDKPGLQRQLDELRELIRLGLSGNGNGSSSDDPQDKRALETMRRLQSENEQQRVRIIHLLRALDSKDRLIDLLRTELGRN
ncbi:hypothetical protein COEREDRAFT_87619 [Coemansia reversa NRRL 1564]|uniref:Uncharacterized protein n=1 Tax=Coemansia reversa (strain ATCC 12441 / NRRL 1564) TaxID=763665 RepID=A0A2G5B9G7_COERN|nr:hypothetical protein COEREDRAFT_87619 [Coemansia reversa NRRL 1564]|eukprot:PIA15655.1 hypothetical protein COEREDRAFT_87619 [Coemansia reversa NRRL 1564]